MRLYHATSPEVAASILANGFRDAEGTFGFSAWLKGVWVSDWPLGIDEGAKGIATIEVTFDCDDAALDKYEFVGEPTSYREWLIPAKKINKLPRRLLSEDERDVLVDARFEKFGDPV